jgi:hypothetical protein
MAASLLLKRFEATFIDCARDKFAQDIHSPEAVEERLMMKVHNLGGRPRLKLTDREAAALCEILLEVETFSDPRSEAEVMLAREILNRLELPDGWNDPLEFAKVVATMPPEGETEPVERPENLLRETGRSPPEHKYHLVD